ncbi:MAG: hypothetical protein GY847_28750 [Proteobacteria bacterium]|nr:hypothetical protein [Pseudomonadota bacterium]
MEKDAMYTKRIEQKLRILKEAIRIHKRELLKNFVGQPTYDGDYYDQNLWNHVEHDDEE